MKFLKPYNENIRQYLKPKPEEEIMKAILKLPEKEHLLTACEYEMWNFVKKLIEEGADIDSFDNFNTPLSSACIKNNLEMVKYLISKGANVNKRVGNNNSPLTLASMYGHLDIVKYLVENGADMFYRGSRAMIALSCASDALKYDVVDYLLEKMRNIKK